MKRLLSITLTMMIVLGASAGVLAEGPSALDAFNALTGQQIQLGNPEKSNAEYLANIMAGTYAAAPADAAAAAAMAAELQYLSGISNRDIASFADPAAQLAVASGLPVLSITTAEGILPGEDDLAASLTIYQTNGGRLQAVSTPIEINERGNTSRRFPKKSYRVKIVNEDGEKDNLSIAGLRSDDDWILNPMYTDTSKIREALAYQLWEEINTSSVFAASSRVAYCEVYINGEYWGLYGIQERIDRKQVDGDKQADILYKVIANDRPGCQVLQAVMMGSFTDFDPADSLNVRVLSAALPRLTTVAEDDFAHFSDSNNVDETIIRQFYYIALGNCLWADITISPLAADADEQNARTVLHLFLAPAEEKDSVEQREIIRANTTQQTLEVISEKAKVPVGFVEYLMLNGNEEAVPSTGRLQNENA